MWKVNSKNEVKTFCWQNITMFFLDIFHGLLTGKISRCFPLTFFTDFFSWQTCEKFLLDNCHGVCAVIISRCFCWLIFTKNFSDFVLADFRLKIFSYNCTGVPRTQHPPPPHSGTTILANLYVHPDRQYTPPMYYPHTPRPPHSPPLGLPTPLDFTVPGRPGRRRYTSSRGSG